MTAAVLNIKTKRLGGLTVGSVLSEQQKVKISKGKNLIMEFQNEKNISESKTEAASKKPLSCS